MKTNLKIREIYEDAKCPAAIVDANSYIVWANEAARQEYPELFKRNGLRELARFSDERVLISRLVKNGIGGTVHPRQAGYGHIQFTLTPLPETGKEMLLTVAEDKKYSPGDVGFGTGIVACSVPTVKEIASRVCENIDLARSGDRETAAAALERALDCCGELVGAMDRMALFADLSAGGRPNVSDCDTAAYFAELTESITQVLRSKAPAFTLDIKENIIMDHALIGRALLLLVSNAVEHGSGNAVADIFTAEGELVIEIRNSIKYEDGIAAAEAVKAFVSYTDEEVNDKGGIGLTVVHMAARSHRGSMSVAAEDGIFTVRMAIPSHTKGRKPIKTEVRSSFSYLEDRFSPVLTELKKFTVDD